MTRHDLAPVFLMGFEPVRVVEPVSADGAHGSDPSVWMWVVGAMVVVAMAVALGALIAGLVAAYRRVRALSPEEDAFRSVCRAMRIPQDHWATIRVLADRIDAAPVAILVSRTAFDRAAGSRSGPEPGAVSSVRSLAFGDDAPL